MNEQERKLCADLRESFPVDHVQFKKEVPPLCGHYYLMRQEGSPVLGVSFLDHRGLVQATGNGDQMKPEALLTAPLPFLFGPMIKIEQVEGRYVAELIDW